MKNIAWTPELEAEYRAELRILEATPDEAEQVINYLWVEIVINQQCCTDYTPPVVAKELEFVRRKNAWVPTVDPDYEV